MSIFEKGHIESQCCSSSFLSRHAVLNHGNKYKWTITAQRKASGIGQLQVNYRMAIEMGNLGEIIYNIYNVKLKVTMKDWAPV